MHPDPDNRPSRICRSVSTRAFRSVITCVVLALVAWGLTAFVHPSSPNAELPLVIAAGRAMVAGEDPYALSDDLGRGYALPPLPAIALAPLGAVSEQSRTLGWHLLNLVICWGCIREAVRLLARWDSQTPAPRWVAWLALVTVALPAFDALGRGEFTLVSLYFLLLGLRLVFAQPEFLVRSTVGGVALALPITLSVTPALSVTSLLAALTTGSLTRRPPDAHRRRTAGAWLGVCLGLALFVLLIPAAVIGWQDNLRHLKTFGRQVLVHADTIADTPRFGPPHAADNQSLSNAVYRLGNWVAHTFADGPDDRWADLPNVPSEALPMSAPEVTPGLLASRIGLAVLLLVGAIAAGYRDDDLGVAVIFALGCVGGLIVAPIARSPWFVLLLPALLLVPRHLQGQGKRRAAVIAAATPPALVVLHYVALPIAGRVGLLGLGITVWYCWALLPLLKLSAEGHETTGGPESPAPSRPLVSLRTLGERRRRARAEQRLT